MNPETGRAAGPPEDAGGPDGSAAADLYGPDGADVYHDISENDTYEIRELKRAVRRRGGPVLELAAGSGRITLPLLASGLDVTGLDLSETLLRRLRGRIEKAPDRVRSGCTVVHGDMSAFDVATRFGAVVLGTNSISLLDDDAREGMFGCVARHLAPDGGFFFTVTAPAAGVRAAGAVETRVRGASGLHYRLRERPAGPRTVVVTIIPEEDGGAPRPVLESTLRTVPARVLEDELGRAGMRIVRRQELPRSAPEKQNVLIEAEMLD
ncbi:hypothetical protein F4561_004898 [Lipingzhangella halophila]|uniref:Methyltransferase domain-containing protein n=1 Tax=Lipingzhangella halophila TaxID=1783352 RepID=A0A7W7W4X9_9ACTN|nr:daptide-type RiPP biosynthesis methyltransferase [Lipingzhangella halophila]MBB4934078.1 hypothetical protein [Lipingzhangella halophila]